MRCCFCCCNTSTSFEPLSMTFLRFYVCLNNRRLIRCTYAVAVCVLKHVSIYTLPLRVCASERHERNVYFSLIERRLVGWVLVALLEQQQRYGLRMFVNTTVGYGLNWHEVVRTSLYKRVQQTQIGLKIGCVWMGFLNWNENNNKNFVLVLNCVPFLLKSKFEFFAHRLFAKIEANE